MQTKSHNASGDTPITISESSAGRPTGSAKKLILVLSLILGLLLVSGLTGVWLKRHFAAAAVEAELSKAKAAGMLTTVEDVQAYVPKVPDDRNAAKFYKQLHRIGSIKNLDPIFSRFSRGEEPPDLQEMMSVVAEGRHYLELVKKAASYEESWFDHDWAQGYGLVFSYYSKMKASVKLLILEAQINIAQGNQAGAIDSIEAAVRVANHAEMDRTEISYLVGYNLKTLVAEQLIVWAATTDNNSVWKEELSKVLASLKIPSLREMAAFDLLNDVITVDAVKTKKGRDALGLQESPDGGLLKSTLATTKSSEDGILLTIKARRKLWDLYGKEDSANQAAIDEALREVYDGLISNLDAATVVEWHTYTRDSIVSSRQKLLAKKLLLGQALFLINNPSKKSLRRFKEVLSPEDRRPLRVEVSPEGIWLKFEGSSTTERDLKVLVPIRI